MQKLSRVYSVARIKRLAKRYGSISKAARAAFLAPATLTKFLAGKRPALNNITCAALDDLYNRTF